MGSAHTRKNGGNVTRLAMLAKFMGSAHTRKIGGKHIYKLRVFTNFSFYSFSPFVGRFALLRARQKGLGGGRSAGFAGALAARTPLCFAAIRVPAGRLPLVAARRTPVWLLRYSAGRLVPAGRLPLVAARRTPACQLRLLRVSGTRTLPLVAIGYQTHSAF